jgi:hypothetical protein
MAMLSSPRFSRKMGACAGQRHEGHLALQRGNGNGRRSSPASERGSVTVGGGVVVEGS